MVMRLFEATTVSHDGSINASRILSPHPLSLQSSTLPQIVSAVLVLVNFPVSLVSVELMGP
jgi:hypothetical protein